jgi:hypothetical protein
MLTKPFDILVILRIPIANSEVFLEFKSVGSGLLKFKHFRRKTPTKNEMQQFLKSCAER